MAKTNHTVQVQVLISKIKSSFIDISILFFPKKNDHLSNLKISHSFIRNSNGIRQALIQKAPTERYRADLEAGIHCWDLFMSKINTLT